MKTLLALFMMTLSAASYGQLVKCVTKDGKVEYARDCPAGATESKTGIRSTTGGGAAPSAPPAQKSLAERDADFKKRAIEQQEAQQKDAKKAAEASQRREDCENAQTYLKSVESGVRLQRMDPKTGERVFLDDTEQAAEATRARARVSQTCN